jgi:hypothetical protein
MDINDFVLKSKVNVAVARDPRISVFDIGVRCNDGIVTLTGDVATESEFKAAEEDARNIAGIRRVYNELTVGIEATSERVEMITSRLLAKLSAEWDDLPERTAAVQCDYMRWALWLIHKFHVSPRTGIPDGSRVKADTTESSLNRVSRLVGVSPVVLTWIMEQQAEQLAAIGGLTAPEFENIPLAASPINNGN